jgi:predicted dehydrogenase
LPIPAKYRYVPDSIASDSPYNVAQLYAKLGASIRNGTKASPGFDAAVRRHRLVDALIRASRTGQKQLLA